MTQAGFGLDAYLARIGYAGPREASLPVLRDLHRLHVAAIPFENLSPLIGDPVSLALPDLQAKLVRGGRGGYCYEHNGLFRAALSALGFEVQGLAARVRWGLEPDAPSAGRSHMAMRVSLPEGPFIADVGFGGMTMSGPVALRTGEPQPTPHERFRLEVAADGDYELQAETGETWRPLYRFDLTPYLPHDYEALNWFVATHPASLFTNHLIAARAEPHRRLALMDKRFTVREAGQPPVERTLGSLDELAQVLTQDFGLTLPDGFERVRSKLGLS